MASLVRWSKPTPRQPGTHAPRGAGEQMVGSAPTLLSHCSARVSLETLKPNCTCKQPDRRPRSSAHFHARKMSTALAQQAATPRCAGALSSSSRRSRSRTSFATPRGRLPGARRAPRAVSVRAIQSQDADEFAAGAYTRPLLSSTWAVSMSDTNTHPKHRKHSPNMGYTTPMRTPYPTESA